MTCDDNRGRHQLCWHASQGAMRARCGVSCRASRHSCPSHQPISAREAVGRVGAGKALLAAQEVGGGQWATHRFPENGIPG